MIQCHGYALYAQYMLFGKTQNSKINPEISGSRDIKYERLSNPTKEQIMKLPLGALVRNESPAHSVIILDAGDEAVRYIDCNCADDL